MEEIDLKELISIFLRRKFLIAVVVIISAIIGAVYTLNFIVPVYQSKTSLILVQVNDLTFDDDSKSITSSDLSLNSNLVYDYVEVAKSKLVCGQVMENLQLDMDYETFMEGISITTLEDTKVINIVVSNEDPELACTIAREMERVFIEKTESIYKISNVHVLDTAEVAEKPSNIHLAKNILVSSFVGLIAVFAYILLVNMLDTTVKKDTDIERIIKVPVLTSIVYTDENTKKKTKSKLKSSYESKSTYRNGGKI